MLGFPCLISSGLKANVLMVLLLLPDGASNGNLVLTITNLSYKEGIPMTQTVKGQKGTPQAQKQYRPGQRQKERLQRQVRRRRQRLLITASLLGVVLIVLAGVGVWQ